MKMGVISNKVKIYFYPINKDIKNNTYANHFVDALSKKNDVVNFNAERKLVADLWKYRFADVFILNWPENLAFGNNKLIKAICYALLLLIHRCRGKKIIWIFHNKFPHEGHNTVSKFLMKFNARISTLIVTHSKEGQDYCRQKYYKKSEIIYYPHPVYPEYEVFNESIKYDVIIWGTVKKYKRILEFLQFYNVFNKERNYKLLLCGKCDDPVYVAEINKHLNDNIEYINDLVPYEDLNSYISASENILFTYNDQSVLSSGALIYSLPFKKKIIAPNKGAFKDLSELGCVVTYHEFDQIFEIIDNRYDINTQNIDSYLKEYTWEKFVSVIGKYY